MFALLVNINKLFALEKKLHQKEDFLKSLSALVTITKHKLRTSNSKYESYHNHL